MLEKEKHAIEEKLKQIPETNNDDLDNLYEVIKDNHGLLQFFYYDSLKYVKRLKSKEYSQLIEIVEIEESEKQVKEFNKWVYANGRVLKGLQKRRNDESKMYFKK